MNLPGKCKDCRFGEKRTSPEYTFSTLLSFKKTHVPAETYVTCHRFPRTQNKNLHASCGEFQKEYTHD